MMIASATTFLAVAVVLGVIGYRVFRAEGRAPAFSAVNATLPAGAKVISTAIGDGHLAVTIETAAGIEIRLSICGHCNPSAGCLSRPNPRLQILRAFATGPHWVLVHDDYQWSSTMAEKTQAKSSRKAAADSAIPQDGIVVGKSTKYEVLDLKFGNRHGLVTGATGTGKTVTLQVLAEGFAQAGVPVFAADIKGDLSGISAAGEAKEAFVKRAQAMGLPYQPDQFSTVFWDVFGEQGHPIRATISEMGPLLLSRLLQLNDTQEGVLNIAFRVADEQGLALLDLKDLRAMLNLVAENAAELQKQYGNVSAATVGTIQRQLLVLENQGATSFFGEPALDINDFMRVDRDGRGMINILSADKLIANPRLYATFLLWMLSELFEQLPEIGDPDKPKLVFFFDEAHLLFNDAPKPLLEKIEQVVRLIRSKGVGVFFRHAKPARRAGNGAGAARQPRAARVARLHAARPEGGQGGGGYVPAEPEAQHRAGHHRTRQGRGAGVVPRRQWRAVDGRTHHDPPAVGSARHRHAGGAKCHHRGQPGHGQIRHRHRR